MTWTEHAPNTATAIPLTAMEKLVVLGLAARDREILTQHVLPLQEDMQAAMREIESRAGLEPGAIGTTHTVDGDAMVVRLIEKAE